MLIVTVFLLFFSL